MTHDVFISYSSSDKPTSDAVCSALEAQGIRCWMAPRDIVPGKDWGASIVGAIKNSSAMVLIFSAHANRSPQIKREVERAVNQCIPVIPLRIENVAPTETLEYFISSSHWLDAFTPPFERHLQYLGQVVRQIVGESAGNQADAVPKVHAARLAEEKLRAVSPPPSESPLPGHSFTQPAKTVAAADASPTRVQNALPPQRVAKIPGGAMEGERRQVTVLAATISDTASLYERLDPEDAANLIGDCLNELAQCVARHEGTVDRFAGESITAVFGAPIALEDDAERALRAALSMREMVRNINRRWEKKLDCPLNFQIGVNTGEVIAGNVGSDSRMNYTILGDTVNVAAGLQDAADAGQILVGQKTCQMTRGVFAFQDRNPLKVKGRMEPLPVHELMHARIQPSKMRGLEGLTPTFIGREREGQKLRKVLEQLTRGSGQIAAVIGEAGIGKSRLLAEMRRDAAEEVTWIEGHCFAYSRNLSYGPFLDLLRRFADIADEDGEIEARANLRTRLEQLFPDDLRMYVIFAHLLSMRLESNEAGIVGKMTGEAFRKELFAAMEKFLLGLAAQKPVVIVLEDLHWADQSSIELASHLCSLTACAPIALVALFRSRGEASGNWEKFAPAIEGFRDRYLELSLQPLSGDSSRDLVEGLLNGSSLPRKFCDKIIDKSEGNPFFVEEMLRSLMERGILVREGAAWKITESVDTIHVPDTLQGLLLSRLDRLPDQTKRVVQKAAVVGRVFLYRILKHIAQGDDALESQMTLIEDAELVRERTRLPEIEYVFKHALTQEVAYKTLLVPARKLLHQSVGRAMEEIFAERIEEFTGLLAYHYFSGESWEKALEYSARAADYTAALFAYAESREHYRCALECLKHLPDAQPNRRMKVDLTLGLVNVSFQAVSPEQNLALLTEAETTARLLQDRLRLARIQLWIGRVYYLAGKTREAIAYFQLVLPVASESNDPELLSLPGAVIGRALFMQGDFARAQQLLDQSVPLLEAAKNHRELLFAYIFRGGTRTAMGNFAAGSADITNALKMARAARNQNAETMAHTGFALIKLVAGRHAEAMVHAREALLVAEKTGDAMFRYSSNAFMAWGLTGIGDHAKALAHWAAAHEAAKPLGGHLLLGDWLAAMESETYFEKGDCAAACEKAAQAQVMAKASGSMIAEALAQRILGRAHAAQSHWQQAEEHLANSASLLQTINAQFDLARTSFCQAKVALAQKNQQTARKFLERTIQLAAACGLQHEENAARTLLADLPPPP